MSFARLGLAPAIVSALESLNYHQPTEIQQKAIPAVLSGRNLLAAAQTGTGKTAAFGLPL
ncbi:MAG: DEAD/DEAH box helicase, partial [Shewanella sp.]|nr:DEAD/DEAH box helicase [Shewanella sp.]